jgi:hypothetical protein
VPTGAPNGNFGGIPSTSNFSENSHHGKSNLFGFLWRCPTKFKGIERNRGPIIFQQSAKTNIGFYDFPGGRQQRR